MALSVANNAILEGAQSILSSTGETAAGSRQIAAARRTIKQRRAASCDSAPAEQAQGAEDIAAAIEEIASLAEALKQQNA